MNKETADSLVIRLKKNMDQLASKGISMDRILKQAIITPACGLGTGSIKGAERALATLEEISLNMKEEHGF